MSYPELNNVNEARDYLNSRLNCSLTAVGVAVRTLVRPVLFGSVASEPVYVRNRGWCVAIELQGGFWGANKEAYVTMLLVHVSDLELNPGAYGVKCHGCGKNPQANPAMPSGLCMDCLGK